MCFEFKLTVDPKMTPDRTDQWTAGGGPWLLQVLWKTSLDVLHAREAGELVLWKSKLCGTDTASGIPSESKDCLRHLDWSGNPGAGRGGGVPRAGGQRGPC